jgi:hypothetical protein
MSAEGTLLDAAVQKCPFPFYRSLREQQPVVYMPEIGGYYVASYDLAREILLDPIRFSNRAPTCQCEMRHLPWG